MCQFGTLYEIIYLMPKIERIYIVAIIRLLDDM